LTMGDIPTALNESYAHRRQSLERSKIGSSTPPQQGTTEWVSWSSRQEEDLVFSPTDSHLFPWEVPNGVTWLEYLFGTHIQMTRALFSELPGWSEGGQREIILDSETGERLSALSSELEEAQKEELLQELSVIQKIVDHLSSKFAERTYAKTRTGEALAP
jgi:hypothetical protein